jgi:hypothetical protein
VAAPANPVGDAVRAWRSASPDVDPWRYSL